jgi:hypothetical protein
VVFAAFVAVILVSVAGVIAFVARTVRDDERAARIRDEQTEQWLDEHVTLYDLEADAQERAAEAMLAARHRAPRRRPKPS